MLHFIVLQGQNLRDEQNYNGKQRELAALTHTKADLEKAKGKAEERLSRAKKTIANQQRRFSQLSQRFSLMMAKLGFAGELAMVETGQTACPFKVGRNCNLQF